MAADSGHIFWHPMLESSSICSIRCPLRLGLLVSSVLLEKKTACAPSHSENFSHILFFSAMRSMCCRSIFGRMLLYFLNLTVRHRHWLKMYLLEVSHDCLPSQCMIRLEQCLFRVTAGHQQFFVATFVIKNYIVDFSIETCCLMSGTFFPPILQLIFFCSSLTVSDLLDISCAVLVFWFSFVFHLPLVSFRKSCAEHVKSYCP